MVSEDVMRGGPKVEGMEATAYTIPTETPEEDGTLRWDHTTMVVARVRASGHEGMGYTYAHRSCVTLIADVLDSQVRAHDCFDISGAWARMNRAIRNLGPHGLATMAVSAVDTALWDLKARILGVPLVKLLGMNKTQVALYGSGGFTNYSEQKLIAQLSGWAEVGFPFVKMKIGRDPVADVQRVRAVRDTIGSLPDIFVDANGAYQPQVAVGVAEYLAESKVTWFEEPVSSEDIAGLIYIRQKAPPAMAIAAGEYVYTPAQFSRFLTAGAVDVLQADVTRCGGYTGFAHANALCRAHNVKLSCHCAPVLHLPIACAGEAVIHMEYFFDHVRIEKMLFDGVPEPRSGHLKPDLSAPGNGLTLKGSDAAAFAA